jgi:hypothetical protein
MAVSENLGCLDAASLDEMCHGKSPTIRKGRYRGDQLSEDHIIPRARVPQIDNVIANLELLPQRVNSAKKAKMGAHELTLDVCDNANDAASRSRDLSLCACGPGIRCAAPTQRRHRKTR